MDTENLNKIPDSNDPPSVTEYIVEGKIYSVARYFGGGKKLEEVMAELVYRQADREFKITTKGNTSKGLKS